MLVEELAVEKGDEPASAVRSKKSLRNVYDPCRLEFVGTAENVVLAKRQAWAFGEQLARGKDPSIHNTAPSVFI